MPFKLEHPLVSVPLELSTHTEGDEVFFRVAQSGTFSVLYPGQLWKQVIATVTYRDRTPQQPTEPELPPTIEGKPSRTSLPPAQPPLHRRILKLIGEDGGFIRLFGKQEDGFAKAKLMVTDPAAAEAIDMHR